MVWCPRLSVIIVVVLISLYVLNMIFSRPAEVPQRETDPARERDEDKLRGSGDEIDVQPSGLGFDGGDGIWVRPTKSWWC